MGRAWLALVRSITWTHFTALSAKRVGQSEVGKAIYDGGMEQEIHHSRGNNYWP